MSAVTPEILAAIAGIVGDVNVVTAASEVAYAARPRSEAEVGDLIRLARDRGFALVTADGAMGADRESVFLDLRHLNHIGAINRTNLTVDAQAGVTLSDLEERLNRDRLTLGPLPAATMGQTVGEWLGRRSGFFPTARYGNWNDLVLALSGALANSELFAGNRTPRSAVGPDLDHLIIGGRSLLAVITGATLSVRPVPAWSRVRAFAAPDFAIGLEAVRRVCSLGYQPARALLDCERTTAVAKELGIGPGGALLVVSYEGEDSALSRARAKQGLNVAGKTCQELPPKVAEKILAIEEPEVEPALVVGALWSRTAEVVEAAAAAGAVVSTIVHASPVGVALGLSVDGGDDLVAKVVDAVEAAGGTGLGPRPGWPFGGPAQRQLLREWKLRLDPGLVLNPALLPKEIDP